MNRSQAMLAYTLIAFLSSSCLAEEARKNLLSNGDFSEVGKDGRPKHWKIQGKGDAVVVENDAGREGRKCLAVQINTLKAMSLGQIHQVVEVKSDTRYRLTGDLKATVKGIGLLQVKRYKSGKEVQRLATGKNTGAAWQTVELRFNSGDADRVYVLCRYPLNEASTGKKVWFANLRLEEASELSYTGAEVPPRAVPTFNSVGLYWKPTGGAPKHPCTVRYRKKGAEDWRKALDLWCDPNEHDGAEAHTLEYRGSIVHLEPGAKYEVDLSISTLNLKRRVEFETWSNAFPIVRRVDLPAKQEGMYVIKEGGGREKGYVLYAPAEGTEARWDGRGVVDVQVRVEAPWVIVRGLKLMNAKKHGIELMDVNHVVIEGCEISGWGQIDPRDNYGVNLHSAVFSASKALETIVVQNCNLHHPRSDSNSWQEPCYTGNKHPRGPQGISFKRGRGRYVIRNNRIHSDLDHMFNDAMGELHNFSYDGFPNRDSDVHDNFVSHCWDDGLEIEGANMNVRVWNNYIDLTWGAIGAASPSLGPVYFWRNVYAVSRAGRTTDSSGYRGHYLFKLGNEKLKWVQGKMYVFHNTSLQPPAYAGRAEPCGAQVGIVFTSPRKQAHNITTRNNIFHLRFNGGLAVRDAQKTASNDFDHDLHNGRVAAKEGSERHGIKAEPTYQRAPDGRLWLAPGTPGHDAGIRIPNFNDDYLGAAPDMGAVETGTKTPRPRWWPRFPEPARAADRRSK